MSFAELLAWILPLTLLASLSPLMTALTENVLDTALVLANELSRVK